MKNGYKYVFVGKVSMQNEGEVYVDFGGTQNVWIPKSAVSKQSKIRRKVKVPNDLIASANAV